MTTTNGSTRATTADLVRIERAGYRVERWGDHGWILLDPEGGQLQITGHGAIAPRKVDAVVEALERIELDRRQSDELGEAA